MQWRREKLSIERSMLIVVDVQGKLAGLMHEAEWMQRQLSILIDGSRMLGLPVIWAEQLPDKLGKTVPAIAQHLTGLSPMVKSAFGCCQDPLIHSAIVGAGRQQILLCGIEAHVCVWQTAVSLLEQGFEVHLIQDAISSRSPVNKQIALQRMIHAGAIVSSVEMALFEMMNTADHPAFRDIVKLLK